MAGIPKISDSSADYVEMENRGKCQSLLLSQMANRTLLLVNSGG